MAENLIKAIDRWGIETPTKIAYDYLGKTNTYAELKAYSDALASYLLNLNLPKGAPVIVLEGRTLKLNRCFFRGGQSRTCLYSNC